jgi:AraC-like DNA-binding protein
MQSEHLISVTYWNHFLRYAQEHNVNLLQLGALSNLDATEHYIPLSHVKLLIEVMLEQDIPPWLGLEVADSISVSSHGHLGFGLSHAQDFKQCLDFVVKFYPTRSQIVDFSLSTQSDYIYLSITPSGDWSPVEIVLYEGVIKMLHNFIRFAIGNLVNECLIELPYDAPAWHATYPSFLGPHIQFSAPVARIRFPVAWLAIRCLSGDPHSLNMAQEQCEVELLRLAQQHTYEDKIIHLLEASRCYELTIEEAAHKLNLSKSTLIRKLRQENTSFKSIIETLKKRDACRLLNQTNQKIDVIAMQLGYEDVSNFSRTFKRWFACSPGAYREKQQQQQQQQ